MKRALVTALFALLALLPRRALAAPIHLWHAYRDDELAALVAILAQWKGEPVSAVSIPYDAYNAKLAAAIPLGDGPDLFIAEHKYLGDFRYRKLVAPVGDALEPGVFSAPALAAVRDGDVAWAVPLSNKCVALYVNTALVDHTPADLEGMADLAGKLGPGVVPLAFETRNAYYVAAILSAFGGALIDDQDRFGFIGPDAVRRLVDTAQDPDFYVCGPGPFMDLVETTLLDRGVSAHRIHIERFTPDEWVPEVVAVEGGTGPLQVTIELDGRTESTDYHPGTTILQTARQMGLSPPFSCESGSCATCMARLLEGTASMHVNNALTDDEVVGGWVLTCQAVPTSPSVRVAYGYEES